uniref:Galactosylgalactosylxylosylprotein 3-beta-glucuronosyltransferase n=1 Tax=Crocodylus porosus TaxID=8502 RepID=A0A7M4F4P9_CROPO
MRTTRKVSVWPVGLVGGRRYERPIVENGRVVGWYTGWRPDRPFAIDMAGFAVSLQVILSHPKAVFKRRGSQPGMQESDFLKQITTVEELEPKANNCTKLCAECLTRGASSPSCHSIWGLTKAHHIAGATEIHASHLLIHL